MSPPLRMLRIEDLKLLTVGGTFVDDLTLDGAAHVVFVRSNSPHARIVAIEADAARAAPGVLGVFAAADLALAAIPPEAGTLNQAMPQPPLADGVVRHVGEAVVALAAETQAQAVDAAALVRIEYDPLAPLVDPEEALRDEIVLHEAAGTNVALRLAFARPAGRSDDLFADCEVIARVPIRNQRLAPCPLEPRAAAAAWGGDGRLTYWAGTQGAHTWRESLARAFGLPEERVRVVSPDVGGSFGSKSHPYPEDLVLAALARRLGRPVRWVETRSESMLALGHGRAQLQVAELGGMRDGTMQAYRLTVVQDAGAYPRFGAILPFMTRTMLTGVYSIDRARFTSTSVVTTTTPVVAYRGAGRPEATAALERVVDVFAAEIGLDPAEVRRRNLIPRDAFPFTALTRAVYDSGDYERALDRVLELGRYTELRHEQRRRREAGDARALGIGLSVYVQMTSADSRGEYASVEVCSDGAVVVHTGTAPHGQGHVTAWASLAAERLGVPLEQITVVYGDTDRVREGGGTGGSRSLQTGGVAVAQAAAALARDAQALAVRMLGAGAELDRGVFRVGERTLTWEELASAADAPLRAEVSFVPSGATFPFGAHLAVVDVDTETGKVHLRRLVAVDDAGRILDPVLFEGQVHGGLAQGAAQALLEEMRFGPDGRPLTTDLWSYGAAAAPDLPSFETAPMETPTPLNELGAKGIGESGAIGSPPAVQNAVVDALAHLGVRHVDMPATPERVWHALREARRLTATEA